jgi:hypothetical protein
MKGGGENSSVSGDAIAIGARAQRGSEGESTSRVV